MDDITFEWVPDLGANTITATITRQLSLSEQRHWLDMLAKAWAQGAIAIRDVHPAWHKQVLENENPYEAMLRSLA